MRSSGRSIVAVATSVLLMVGLGACAGIPSSGPVITGGEVSQQEPGTTEFVIDGPTPGDSQEEILSGFIDAFKSSGDYSEAREFLSADFAPVWDPRESVLVRTGSVRYNTVSTTAMQYIVSTNAAVDSSGSYSPYPTALTTLDYEFVQEGEEWRISSAPNGIVLAPLPFTTIFAQNVLYFLDPTARNLVPDLRWFPSGTTATRAVSALLAGPPVWLQGAVGTSFPEGTQLTSPKRVAVQESVATVDLTTEALAATPAQRQLMRLQIEASLGQIANITSVVITVDGTPLEIGAPGPGLPEVHPQVDSRSLVYMEGEFGFYSSGQLTPIDGLSEKVVALEPRAASLTTSRTAAAVLGSAGLSFARTSQASSLLLDTRQGLIAPSVDGSGYVWSVPAASPGDILAFDLDGRAYPVANNLPSDARIVSLQVSREGARVAILLATSAGPRLIVAAIIRDANQAQSPVRLGEPVLDTIDQSGAAVDVTWLDETTVATMTSSASETAVISYRVGGQRSSLGNPGPSIAVVGGNGEAGLRVLGADGVIAARRGSGWQSTQVTVDFIATQR